MVALVFTKQLRKVTRVSSYMVDKMEHMQTSSGTPISLFDIPFDRAYDGAHEYHHPIV